MAPVVTPLLLLAVSVALPLRGQELAPAVRPVWVNLNSGVYHCPGTEYYGATSRGEFLPESTAVANGYRPNGGHRCAPAPPPVQGAGPVPPPTRTIPALLPDSGPRQPSKGLMDCEVVTLRDGDTIQCKVQGPVRLIGIDTPERDQAPYGTAATAGMAALIPDGATVKLNTDVTLRDRYGRLLAYVWYRGESINWLMVRLGWAVSVRYPPNLRYAGIFDDAEARAATEERGLWRVEGFSCRPADHRAQRC